MLACKVLRADGRPLAPLAKASQTHVERLQGWLGLEAAPQDGGLILKPCASIHTLGMKFPIDLAYLDQEGTVLKVVPHLKPNRLSIAPLSRLLRPWSCQALELPAGAAAGLAPGERLVIEERQA